MHWPTRPNVLWTLILCCPSLMRINGNLPIRTAMLHSDVRVVVLVESAEVILHRPTIRSWPPRTRAPLSRHMPPIDLLLCPSIRMRLARTTVAPLMIFVPVDVTRRAKNCRYLLLAKMTWPSVLNRECRPVINRVLERSGRHLHVRLVNTLTRDVLSLVLSRHLVRAVGLGTNLVIIASLVSRVTGLQRAVSLGTEILASLCPTYVVGLYLSMLVAIGVLSCDCIGC